MPGGVMQLARQTRAPIVPVDTLAADPVWRFADEAGAGDSARRHAGTGHGRWCCRKSERQILAHPQLWSWQQRRWRGFPLAAHAGRCMTPMHDRTVALTGATGFIGRRLVVALAAAGWRVRMLLRRDPVVSRMAWHRAAGRRRRSVGCARTGPAGAMASTHVIHVAGLIKAARRQDFYAVNAGGSVAVGRGDHAART